RALQRPKTRIYFREGRHFVGDNRNYGISQARGKYICCLDADDLIRPTYLEKAVFLLEAQGYDVVSTSIQCFGDSAVYYGMWRFPTLADMVRGNHVSTCAVFRKDLWKKAGGFQDTGIGRDYVYEDWRLWIRFSALGARIANIVEESLFRYRVHSESSLSKQDETVPPLARQHEAVVTFNDDVLTDEAFRLSEDRKRQRIQVLGPLVNLLSRQTPDAGAPTVLIALPFLFVGGAERLLSEMSLHLRTRGYRIVIVTTVPVDPKFGDSTEWFERATAEIFHLPRFLEPEWWREFIFYLIETKDVSLLWLAGSVVVYDLLPEIKAEWPGLKVTDLLFNTVGHTASNRKHRELIDVTLVENREVHDWLLKAGENPEKVLLIPSGVDLERYRPGPKPGRLLEELGIDPSSFIVGFSGRMSEEKSPESFLEIADRCRDDSRFVFLMTGAGPLADSVRQRIDGMGLGDRLRFLGKVEDVRQVLALYDVLVLPSRLDGRPVVVLESLAMGVPVVASRVGGVPELVREGETGFLCESGDVSGFADRVRWLAAHPQEHRRMKAAARAFAEAELDGRRMLQRYEEAIRGVLIS
ncbi:glycosyltransferase, partial [bacterium]